jgi:AAA ATPase domain
VGSSTGRFDVGTERLVASPIRGRTDELKVIGASVTAVAQGRGGVLVIEGPPGIGKSRLLTEVMALADKRGVRTLFGEAFEYQQAVPFFALFMAALRADPPIGDADALRRLGSSADLRYWVVHDLADAIDAAAAETPLAIVLEDIHWADPGSDRMRSRACCCAGPATVSTVVEMDRHGNTVVLRKGTNDWVCFPGDENEIGNVPMCADPMGLQWMMDIMAGKPAPTNTAPGIIYMLCGATQHSNTDPSDRTSPPIPIGPHWMILWPCDATPDGLPNTVRDAGAWVMFDGTPYAISAYLRDPVGRKRIRAGPSTHLDNEIRQPERTRTQMNASTSAH